MLSSRKVTGSHLSLAPHRKKLAQEPRLIEQLITLMSSSALKIQCQAALALRNLASDGQTSIFSLFPVDQSAQEPHVESYQLSIVSHGGLPPLLKLLSTTSPPLLLAAVACVRNVSIHHLNESAIVAAGFLPPLIALLTHENEEIQCHAISTLRNVAAGMEEESNRERIVDGGGITKMIAVMQEKTSSAEVSPLGWQVLSEMTAAIAVLALSSTIFRDVDGTKIGHSTWFRRLAQGPADEAEFDRDTSSSGGCPCNGGRRQCGCRHWQFGHQLYSPPCCTFDSRC